MISVIFITGYVTIRVRMKKLSINAFTLKIIAVISMIIDHFAASGLLRKYFPFGWFGLGYRSTYRIFRILGRFAFPIYCFLLIEGIRHTRDWRKYALRLFLFALLSEIPFDMAFRHTFFEYGHQNVYFTLFLGLLPVVYLQRSKQEKPLRYLYYAAMVGISACLAHWVFHCDYRAGGIVQIGIFGLLSDTTTDRLRNLVLGVAGILACCLILRSTTETYALLSLLLISCYNGKKGPSGEILKYTFYIIYPVHLFLFGWLFMH